MSDPATGTVTFLFTDIEGSTRLWETEPAAMRAMVARHDALLRTVIESHSGYIFTTTGDGMCAAFARARDAVAASVDLQSGLEALEGSPRLLVRIAIHTGEAEERDGDYFGPALNEAGRLLGVAHGGQVLCSGAVREVLGVDLPQGVRLVDLGEHRLRDVRRFIRVFQVSHDRIGDRFPPLKTEASGRTNLPVQVTSFVGRHEEMVEVDKFLRGAPLVTITGVGGAGKTRLAIEVASRLVPELAGAVWYADLSPVTAPALVVPTVARAVGLAELGTHPIDTVAGALSARKGLLVVDNCELLLDQVRPLMMELMRRAGGVRLLATSREALAISGEVVWRLPPLNVPTTATPARDVRRFDAVRLFEERADAAKPGFRVDHDNAEAVARICRRLEGIPLGLELAAARLRLLGPEEIADRLEESLSVLGTAGLDVAAHHRTLEATLDWSYRLLAREEQDLFARLSVFSGGWTIEAAEHVVSGEGLSSAAVLGLLGSLVDKSLVAVGQDRGARRSRFLEPVRRFAADKLEPNASGLKERHALYFAELAEHAFEGLIGPQDIDWLDRVEADIDNLRAALEWLLGVGRVQEAQMMAGALYRFWARTRRVEEAISWRDRVLAADDTPSRAVARALLIGSSFDGYRIDDAIDLYRRFGPDEELAVALNNRAVLATQRDGDWRLAVRLYEEARDLLRAKGKFAGLQTCNLAGVKLFWEGDLEGGRELAVEGVEEARGFGSANMLHSALSVLGSAEAIRGNIAAALAAYEEELAIETRPGARIWYLGRARLQLAELALETGDPDGALRHLDALQEQIAGLDYGEEASRGRHESNSLRVRGQAEIRRGEYHRGVVLLGAEAAERVLAPARGTAAPLVQYAIDAVLSEAKDAMGSAAFEIAWQEGSSMTFDEAVAYAAEPGSTGGPQGHG